MNIFICLSPWCLWYNSALFTTLWLSLFLYGLSQSYMSYSSSFFWKHVLLCTGNCIFVSWDFYSFNPISSSTLYDISFFFNITFRMSYFNQYTKESELTSRSIAPICITFPCFLEIYFLPFFSYYLLIVPQEVFSLSHAPFS